MTKIKFLMLSFSPIIYLIGFIFATKLNFLGVRKNTLVSFSSFIFRSKLGRSVRVYSGAVLKNTAVGSYTYIAPDCTIVNASIGNYCSIGAGVKVCIGKHPTNFFSTHPCFYSEKSVFHVKKSRLKFENEVGSVILGHDVWIGANALVFDDVAIGNGAVIGAGSIVTRDVEPYSVVVGIPARHIRFRFEEEQINELQQSCWWDNDPDSVDIEKMEKIVNVQK